MSNGEDLDELELIQKEGDELFLDLIKCLWNKGCKQYYLVDWKHNAMQEVAAILGDTIKNCNEKWETMKRRYNGEKIEQESESRSGAGASTRRPYIWYEYINNFVSKIASKRKPFSNVQSYSAENNEPIHLKKKKQKQTNLTEVALNSVNASLSGIIQQLSSPTTHEKENIEDLDSSIGQVVFVALNQLSPNTAKKKKKKLMKIVYVDDSE